MSGVDEKATVPYNYDDERCTILSKEPSADDALIRKTSQAVASS